MLVKQERLILGREIYFERRRYGNKTFTWAYLKQGDDFVSLGDPWPCINPPKAQLETEVARVLANAISQCEFVTV